MVNSGLQIGVGICRVKKWMAWGACDEVGWMLWIERWQIKRVVAGQERRAGSRRKRQQFEDWKVDRL